MPMPSQPGAKRCINNVSTKAAEIFTILGVFFGVGTYMLEIPARSEARATAAWQILALQSHHEGNGGQKWAMQVLANYNHDLHAIHVKRADLTSDPSYAGGILDLRNVNLSWSVLWKSNLGGAQLIHANLVHADLSCTALGGADLTDADLSGARLTDANLGGAIFTHATFSKDTDTEGVCVDDPAHQPRDFPGGKITAICPIWEKDQRPDCTSLEPRSGD